MSNMVLLKNRRDKTRLIQECNANRQTRLSRLNYLT
jgi:hypothetical protein